MCESNPSDDMASFDFVEQHNGIGDSLDTSEYSLISEQPPLTEENHFNGNFDNIQSAFMSGSQDLSVHEIQERIVELAKDNAAMKEALEWNNVMMKEQLNTISAWHNQMTTSMSQQQLSLKERSEKSDALEKENKELQDKLKLLEQSSKENVEIPICDCKSVQTVSNTEETDQLIASLKMTLEMQIKEIETLKKIAQEKDSLGAIYELLQKENYALKSRCTSLENEFKESLNKEKEKSCLEIHSLKTKISDMETQVLLQQHATEAESIKHGQTKHLLSVLETKYQRVSKMFQGTSRDLEQKNLSMSYEQSDERKKCLEQVDNLTAQLFDMEEKLAEREEKVKLLTAQLEAANKDSESIPVLKSQVEVYKMDLDHVTQTKDEMEAEIQRLNQMIQDFQTQFSSAGFDGDWRDKKWGKKVHAGGSRQIPKVFVCPVCDFGFSDPQSAQNHANKCLDEAQIR